MFYVLCVGEGEREGERERERVRNSKYASLPGACHIAPCVLLPNVHTHC